MPAYPVASSKVRATRSLTTQYKVGKFTAIAESEEIFELFGSAIARAATQAVTRPVQLLTIPHVCNAVALTLPKLPSASRVLVEGYVLELIASGVLGRLATVNTHFEPYFALYSLRDHSALSDGIASVCDALARNGSLSLSRIAKALPTSLASRKQNLSVICGSLIYSGKASTDSAPGMGIETIRLPYAPSEL